MPDRVAKVAEIVHGRIDRSENGNLSASTRARVHGRIDRSEKQESENET